MPSFNATTLNNQVQNGNSVTIMLGDVVIGFGQTAGPSIDWGTEGLYGIGSAMPQDIQQLKNTMTISLDQFLLTDSGLAFLNQPSTMLEVLSNNSFDFHVMNATGNPVLTYVGAVASNFSLQIPANQPITQTTNFIARDILDPLGNSIMSGNNALTTSALIGDALNSAGL